MHLLTKAPPLWNPDNYFASNMVVTGPNDVLLEEYILYLLYTIYCDNMWLIILKCMCLHCFTIDLCMHLCITMYSVKFLAEECYQWKGTDHYLNFRSNHHPRIKTGIVKCLAQRAKSVHHPSHVKSEIKHLQKVLTSNGYPPHLVKRCLARI